MLMALIWVGVKKTRARADQSSNRVVSGCSCASATCIRGYGLGGTR